MGVFEEVKKEIVRNTPINEIKTQLIHRGYIEEEIDDSINELLNDTKIEKNKNNKILSIKELFDRIGYGFASIQFMNILFLLSGASIFLVGFINGLKTAIAYVSSGIIEKNYSINAIPKHLISLSGIIFGFSLFGMAIGTLTKNSMLFVVSILVAAISITVHGDLYTQFYNTVLRSDKRKNFLRFISYFGIMITAISLLLAGYVMESISVNGLLFKIDLTAIGAGTLAFKIFGYIITFEITAVMFILSGYMVSFLEEKKQQIIINAANPAIEYFKENLENMHLFKKNPKITLLTFAVILTTIFQVIGNSYYGIFIYTYFRKEFLGGFMNVALIFVIALITSMSGTLLTKKFAKSLGEAPMLVFGTLLIALLPLTFYYNANLYAIGLATAISVVGASIVGVAQGMIVERLLDEKELKKYFQVIGFVTIIPTIIVTFIGALVAQIFGMNVLFLCLGIGLAGIVMPLYFLIVLLIESEYRKDQKIRMSPTRIQKENVQ